MHQKEPGIETTPEAFHFRMRELESPIGTHGPDSVVIVPEAFAYALDTFTLFEIRRRGQVADYTFNGGVWAGPNMLEYFPHIQAVNGLVFVG